MYVSEHKPDCRVFIRRLVVPNSEVTRTIKPGENGLDYLGSAFGYYLKNYPDDFQQEFLRKYYSDYGDLIKKLQEDTHVEIENLEKLSQKIKQLKVEIDNKIKTFSFSTPTEKAELLKQLTEKENDYDFVMKVWVNKTNSISTVRPLYEPYLLEIAIGITSITTSIVRNGIGTASIAIKLPLEENGFLENILYTIKNEEMFNKTKKEISPITTSQMRKSKGISSRELNIFKIIRDKNDNYIGIDRRECSLLPHDMIQIYFTKRYNNKRDTTKKSTVNIPKFPDDYAPAFTGFIKSTSVNFQGGQNPSYTINITCEDVGHCLRISRANIDPALDPQFRVEGLSTVTAFQSKLQQYGDELKIGSDFIKLLVVGKEGYWGGVSQIEITNDSIWDPSINNYRVIKPSVSQEKDAGRNVFTYRRTEVISLPWDFDKIPLKTYDDPVLGEFWRPYTAAFKQSFRLWESDYKYRWDMCKEIADIMEYEFYADNFGAINYHPPFYNMNPANIKFFIENKEILNETHSFSETNVVTSVEVVSQPVFGIIENVAKMLSSFAKAKDELVQRYGIRFRTKNIPALSGTTKESIGMSYENLYDARYLYARAWLNRRNAEMQSATLDIPGTPEYYLCNTVVFVDSIDDLIAKYSFPTSETTEIRHDIPHAEVKPVMLAIEHTEQLTTTINNLKVYYISGISHKYTQGNNFTTTLTLTHGRTWGKDFNVGYGATDEISQKIKKAMNEYYKQVSERVDEEVKTILKQRTNNLSLFNIGNPVESAFAMPKSKIAKQNEQKNINLKMPEGISGQFPEIHTGPLTTP